MKIANWCCSRLLSKCVQGLVWQIQMHDVERVLEVNDRVAPQVVDLDHPCPVIYSPYMAALGEIVAPPAFAQSQLDQVSVIVGHGCRHAVVRRSLNFGKRKSRFVKPLDD